ncbi:hypothetical protein EYF80_056337 [Liparis tanakae]|uniref:Uncharacterized protein n=1 Tax=Liparis tanakae TaxID=230148 RepID=A0A4Z2EXE7_9TELE|nr:hypothetical protein EYF80_056337 [Liparis tanakae]
MLEINVGVATTSEPTYVTHVEGAGPAGRRLQLHAGDEAAGAAPAVVAQLRGVAGAGRLGEHDGGALEALRPQPGAELQLRLVAAPRAVGHGRHRLGAALHGEARRPQGHGLDEVAGRVVAHGRGPGLQPLQRDGRYNWNLQ